MTEINLTSVLERPIGQKHWSQLESIIKTLNEYIQQRVKNRDYLQAQNAKEKIVEVQDQIVKRNRVTAQRREQRALDQLLLKHEQEKDRLRKEWEVRFRKTQAEFAQLVERKIQKQTSEKEKYRQQIEMALPLQCSPDKDLYHLRAQRVKLQIQKREVELEEKYQKLRESNLRVMMGELQQRHGNDLALLGGNREYRLKEQAAQLRKREKELQEKQKREVKQLKWIYAQQIKRYK